jgi:hypothetical protein
MGAHGCSTCDHGCVDHGCSTCDHGCVDHGCSTCDQILVTSCTRIPMISNLQPNFKTLGPHPLSCLILPCKPKVNLITHSIDIFVLVKKICYQLNIEFCKFWKCIYAFLKV